jgi:hypothetical protein
LNLQYAAILFCYIKGFVALVPWDVYIPEKSKTTVTRYYGKVDQYKDLFSFIAENFKKGSFKISTDDTFYKKIGVKKFIFHDISVRQ